MRKKLKTLLCASALLASFYSGCIYAADKIIIDTEDYKVTEGQQSFQDIEVIAPGKLTIDNGATVTCNNLHNGNQVNNFGKIAPSQLDNYGEITNNLTGIIDSNVTNNDTINNFGNIEARALENHGTISNSGNLTIYNGTNYNKIEQKDITFKGNFTNDKTLISTGTFTNNHVITGGNNSELTINDGKNTSEITQEIINISGNFKNNGKLTSTGTFTNTGTISGGNNSELTINDGKNTSEITQEIINISGNFKNNGKLTSNGTFTNAGTITGGNNSELTIKDGENTSEITQEIINISGNFKNNGKLTSTGTFTNAGTITGGNDSELTVKDGSNSDSITQNKITISAGNTSANGFVNSKSITSNTIENNGVLTNKENATITVNNGTKNNGNITNNGSFTTKSLTNVSGATISGDKGTLSFEQGENQGSISQAIINKTGDTTFTNKGQITAGQFNITSGTLENSGNIGNEQTPISKVINSGTLNNNNGGNIIADAIQNNSQKQITNNGNIIANSSLVNEGTISGNGNLTIGGGSNTGDISQKDITINGNFTNDKILTSTGKFTNTADINGGADSSLSVANGENSGNISQAIMNISGNFTNTETGKIIADITNSGTLTNAGNIGNDTSTKDFTNSNGGILRNSGNVSVKDLINNGSIENNNGTIKVGNDLTNSNSIKNSGTIEIANDLINRGSVENSKTISITNNLINSKKITNRRDGTITVGKTLTNNAGATLVNEKDATIDVSANGAKLVNAGTVNNNGTVKFSDVSAGLENSGSFITNGGLVQDAIVANTGRLTATNGAKLNLISLNNTNGIVNILNSSDLDLSNQTGDLNGTINVAGGRADASGNLIANTITSQINDTKFVGNLNVGDGVSNSTLSMSNILVDKTANLNIAHGGLLVVGNNSTVNLDDNTKDIVNGDIQLLQDGTLNLQDYTLATGNSSTQKNGNQAYYSQSGGVLNLNNSTLKLGDSSAVTGGILNLDSTSQFLVTSEANGTANTFLESMTMADGSRFGAMNSGMADYNITDINVNGTNNFTIDVLGRSNAQGEHGTDRFVGDNLVGNGTINIEDWTLAGDIFGWQAPIDRDLKLDNVFKFNNISPNIQLTATKKEVFTPIGWYQLNNHGGMTGNYELNLTRFNPQVYRGQVTTLAQYMNQLAIDDMLFNHSMLLPSFKDDDLSDNGTMINRLAAANPVYAPYQYSKKDGGLWYRMYGTFETLQMSQGLSRVGNNAYGTIIGADFGLKDLRNGWKFMPTAYIGYNGAHQYFAGMGAYQNGGQAGFLGTWYKNNFVLGGLVYGGVYQNSMDIAGHTDNTFNYFAGASAKGAYNWRLHRDWVLQPNLMLAYNFFGQQNWHTDFGQMGMMSGTLNGINLAPGLNLIWEKETFSIYATLQYMYNLNGAVDGRAGNVSLPHLYMDRGYIQYGFGFTKRFSDRFAGYFQTVFRNVGRTGVGFQLGLNIKLGKE